MDVNRTKYGENYKICHEKSKFIYFKREKKKINGSFGSRLNDYVKMLM